MNPKITVESLSLNYGKQAAFRDITLKVFPGGITAFVGPSGCGKTSFLNCLNRLSDLIPNCRVTGQIHLDSEEIHSSKFNLRTLRQRVGMIFQKPNPFPISIRKNFTLPLSDYGIKKRLEQDEIIESTLVNVGLWAEVKDRLNSSALSLSGGQQQRLCIARALALRPEVILFDEPCSALDPIASSVVEELIATLGLSYTVLIVTHNLSQARRIADNTAMFWVKEGVGQIIEHGQTKKVFENPTEEITKAYISGSKG